MRSVFGAARRQMRKVIGEFKTDFLRGRIVDCVFEHDTGDAGVLVVKGNERIPRGEFNTERKRGISQLDVRERKFSLEDALFEAWETFKTAATVSFTLQTLIENFQDGKWTLHQLGERRRALHVKNGEASSRRGETLGKRGGGGAIGDGEVLQATVAV